MYYIYPQFYILFYTYSAEKNVKLIHFNILAAIIKSLTAAAIFNSIIHTFQ